MNKQEFWQQTIKGKPVMKGISHEYILENGHKIEMYEDGSMEMFCTMDGGHFYQKIKDCNDFFEKGFDVASLERAIKKCDQIIDKSINHSMAVNNFEDRELAIDKLRKSKNNNLSSYEKIKARYQAKLDSIK